MRPSPWKRFTETKIFLTLPHPYQQIYLAFCSKVSINFNCKQSRNLFEVVVLLRDHPLFSYHGMHSWPPVWLWMSGGYDRQPRGEVGILRRVEKSNVLSANRCFLFIDYEDSSYIGCLLCSDPGFCKSIVRVLEAHLNKTIAQIGGLDISRLL